MKEQKCKSAQPGKCSRERKQGEPKQQREIRVPDISQSASHESSFSQAGLSGCSFLVIQGLLRLGGAVPWVPQFLPRSLTSLPVKSRARTSYEDRDAVLKKTGVGGGDVKLGGAARVR